MEQLQTNVEIQTDKDDKESEDTLETNTLIEEVVNNIMSIAEECTTSDELRELVGYHHSINWEKPIVCYDGFEPSGRMHLAQGIMKANIVNTLTDNGCYFKFWVADLFAKMNHKLGGDMKKIRKAGQLMIEIWKLCGMNMDKVEFIWSSDEINKNPVAYYDRVHDICDNTSLKRILDCTPIMGRNDTDSLTMSQCLYPVMQCADIFHLKVNICQLGVDQRKVNMLARDYCTKKKIKRGKPIILSHHMLMGLNGDTKMAKSDPENAIFMDDMPSDVKRKVARAYCKPGDIVKNPILEYFKYIILPKFKNVELERSEEYGGNKIFSTYQQLETDFQLEQLHPADLKKMTIKYVVELLNPIQTELSQNNELKTLNNTVKKYKITR
jgi:tyrosyl-tRNA synthetase